MRQPLRDRIRSYDDESSLVLGADVETNVDGDPAPTCGVPDRAHQRRRLASEVDSLFEFTRAPVKYEIPVVSLAGRDIRWKISNYSHSIFPFSSLKFFCRNAENFGEAKQVLRGNWALSSHPARNAARMHRKLLGHPELSSPLLSKNASERGLWSHERLPAERSTHLRRRSSIWQLNVPRPSRWNAGKQPLLRGL